MCQPDGDSPRARIQCQFPLLAIAALGAMLCGGRASGQCPPPPSSLVESQLSSDATSATIAVRQCGEFIIAIATKITGAFGEFNHIQVQRFNPNGSPLGSPANLTSSVPGEKGTYEYPSISMSRSGRIFAAWGGNLHLFPLRLPHRAFTASHSISTRSHLRLFPLRTPGLRTILPAQALPTPVWTRLHGPTRESPLDFTRTCLGRPTRSSVTASPAIAAIEETSGDRPYPRARRTDMWRLHSRMTSSLTSSRPRRISHC